MIRRFIDPAAKFVFVDPAKYQHSPGELRFDMYEGEFTHEGDLCTLETLLRRVNLNDRRPDAIAQIVHDIDVKDGKYARPETVGIDALIKGIAARHTDDTRRIEEGSTVF